MHLLDGSTEFVTILCGMIAFKRNNLESRLVASDHIDCACEPVRELAVARQNKTDHSVKSFRLINLMATFDLITRRVHLVWELVVTTL